MRRSEIRLAAGAAAFVVGTSLAGAAHADDAPPTEREKKLEKQVEDLQKKVEELSRRMSDGSSRAADELTQRVDELEKVTKKDKDGLFGYWANGIRLDSASGAFKFRIGGRIQNDWSWFSHTAVAEDRLPPAVKAVIAKPATSTTPAVKGVPAVSQQIEAGEEFRRVRLHVGGTIYDNIDFMDEIDFGGGAIAFRNVWIAYRRAGIGTFTVGNVKEPIGTEEMTDDLLTTFLERSSGDEAFAPTYKTGFQYSNTFADQRVAVQAGMYRDSLSTGGANNGNDLNNNRSGDYNFTARVAGRPWLDDENKRYLHVGLAGSSRSPSDDMMQFRSRPELHLAPRFVDTGVLAAKHVSMVEADAAFVSGPFWVFGDFYNVKTERTGATNPTFRAWQLMAGCFLTGESKPYRAGNGTFERVKPAKNFDDKGAWGAWELAGRFSSIDLNDGGVNGGQMDVMTLGVNWYLNPNTRWMLDFVHAKQRDLHIWINALEMRFQIDF